MKYSDTWRRLTYIRRGLSSLEIVLGEIDALSVTVPLTSLSGENLEPMTIGSLIADMEEELNAWQKTITEVAEAH